MDWWMDGRTRVVMQVIFLLVSIPWTCIPKVVVLGKLLYGQKLLRVLVGQTNGQRWSCGSFFSWVSHDPAHQKLLSRVNLFMVKEPWGFWLDVRPSVRQAKTLRSFWQWTNLPRTTIFGIQVHGTQGEKWHAWPPLSVLPSISISDYLHDHPCPSLHKSIRQSVWPPPSGDFDYEWAYLRQCF